MFQNDLTVVQIVVKDILVSCGTCLLESLIRSDPRQDDFRRKLEFLDELLLAATSPCDICVTDREPRKSNATL